MRPREEEYTLEIVDLDEDVGAGTISGDDHFSYFGFPATNDRRAQNLAPYETPTYLGLTGPDWPYNQGHTVEIPSTDALANRPFSGETRMKDHPLAETIARILKEELAREGVYPHTQLNRPLGTGNGTGHSEGWGGSIYPPWFNNYDDDMEEAWQDYEAKYADAKVLEDASDEFEQRWGLINAPTDPSTDALSPWGQRSSHFSGAYVNYLSPSGRAKFESRLADVIENTILENSQLDGSQIRLQEGFFKSKEEKQIANIERILSAVLMELRSPLAKDGWKEAFLEAFALDNPKYQEELERASRQLDRDIEAIKRSADSEATRLEAGYVQYQKALEAYNEEIKRRGGEGARRGKKTTEAAGDIEKPEPERREFTFDRKAWDAWLSQHKEFGQVDPSLEEELRELYAELDKAREAEFGDTALFEKVMNSLFFGRKYDKVTVKAFLDSLIEAFETRGIPFESMLNITTITKLMLDNLKNPDVYVNIKQLLRTFIGALWQWPELRPLLEALRQGAETKWFGTLQDTSKKEQPADQPAEGALTRKEASALRGMLQKAMVAAARDLRITPDEVMINWEIDPEIGRALRRHTPKEYQGYIDRAIASAEATGSKKISGGSPEHQPTVKAKTAAQAAAKDPRTLAALMAGLGAGATSADWTPEATRRYVADAISRAEMSDDQKRLLKQAFGLV